MGFTSDQSGCVQAITKPSPRKQRQGQLPFRSSQEERKGGLSLSLSQPADSKAPLRAQNQSTLHFKPVTRTEATALDTTEVVGTTDTQGVGRGFQGDGPHLQEQKLQEHAGAILVPVMLHTIKERLAL